MRRRQPESRASCCFSWSSVAWRPASRARSCSTTCAGARVTKLSLASFVSSLPISASMARDFLREALALGGDVHFDVQHQPGLADDLDRRVGDRKIVDDIDRGDLRQRRQIGREVTEQIRIAGDQQRHPLRRRQPHLAAQRPAGADQLLQKRHVALSARIDVFEVRLGETAAARSSRPPCRRAAPPSARALR